MKSWNDLPFEIKSLIILHCVKANADDYRAWVVRTDKHPLCIALPHPGLEWHTTRDLVFAVPSIANEMHYIASRLLAEYEEISIDDG